MPRRASKARRRIRAAFRAVLFSRIVSHMLAERRWGTYVEPVENVLLETEARELPGSYFETMSHCPLPAGWLCGVLPNHVQHQIRTFAKNKIVRLLTPLAKLHCLRTQHRCLRTQFQNRLGSVTPTLLRECSPFFKCWTESALRDLVSEGALRAYKPSMWIFPPASSRNVSLPFLLLEGAVEEYSHVAAGEARFVGDVSSISIVAESRNIVDSVVTTGFRSRTVCITFEFDWRFLRAQFLRSLSMARGSRRLSSLSPTIFSALALKKFVTEQRCELLASHFPLSAEQLRNYNIFKRISESEVQIVLQKFVPKVSFEGEEVVAQGHTFTEIIIIARGTAQLVADETALRTLRAGDVFGECLALCDERSHVGIQPQGILDYWSLGGDVLLSSIRSQATKASLQNAARQIGERLLQDTKQLSTLCNHLLECSPSPFKQAAAGTELASRLARLLKPKIFSAGERLAIAGESVLTLILCENGKVSENARKRGVSQQLPTLFGETFLNPEGKWASTITAVRQTECWILNRKDAWMEFDEAELEQLFTEKMASGAPVPRSTSPKKQDDRATHYTNSTAPKEKCVSRIKAPANYVPLSVLEGIRPSIRPKFVPCTPSTFPPDLVSPMHPAPPLRVERSANNCVCDRVKSLLHASHCAHNNERRGAYANRNPRKSHLLASMERFALSEILRTHSARVQHCRSKTIPSQRASFIRADPFSSLQSARQILNSELCAHNFIPPSTVSAHGLSKVSSAL